MLYVVPCINYVINIIKRSPYTDTRYRNTLACLGALCPVLEYIDDRNRENIRVLETRI